MYLTNRSMHFYCRDTSIVATLPHYHDGLELSDKSGAIQRLLVFCTQVRTLDELKLEFGDCAEAVETLVDHNVLIPSWPNDRYDRHRLYYSLKGLDPIEAQNRLLNSRVGILGVGGIGSNVATLLAAAGVKNICLSDSDVVEESNLTRAIKFNSSHLGGLKIDALKAELNELDPSVVVSGLPLALGKNNISAFCEHFSNCDLLILSADSLDNFEVVNEIQKIINCPVLAAGYIDRIGAIGPFLMPTETANYAGVLREERLRKPKVVPQSYYQAPSFGPLNMLVSSYCANEAIRFLVENKSILSAGRLIICPDTYSTEIVNLSDRNVEDSFSSVSKIYDSERETTSINREVLDPILEIRAKIMDYSKVLDIGCGSGTYTRMFSPKAIQVVSVDSSVEMLDVFKRKGVPANARLINSHAIDFLLSTKEKFDLVILALVLDHIDDIECFLSALKDVLLPNAKILVATPSNLRDSCSLVEGQLIVQNYFAEGKIEKTRRSVKGDVNTSVVSNKRTLEKYINIFLSHDFRLATYLTPKALKDDIGRRVPYFDYFEFYV